MNPSRHQLPQFVSDDRRRARADTLRLARRKYVLEEDDPEGTLPEDFRRLPGGCHKLPAEATFPSARLAVLASDRLWSFVNSWAAYATSWFIPLSSSRGYRASFRVVGGPKAIMSRWAEDVEFGRQRLAGVDPLHLRVVREPRPAALWEAAKRFLEFTHPERPIANLLRKNRVFVLDYGRLWHPRIQAQVVHKKGVHLAAPTCLFWSDDTGNLMPLAIQLKPPDILAKNPVFTPLNPGPDWLMARAHVQAAHTHVHEGTYHLLETHLVSGAVALGLYRHVHPDHPLRQLLNPHYEHTLAINRQATGDLLAKGGTIDTGLAAGVDGTLDAARLAFASWSFPERWLHADLAARGVDDQEALPVYPYRDDALQVHKAIDQYVGAMLGIWYHDDACVRDDIEVQAWLAEVADPDRGNVPGFPSTLSTVRGLVNLVTELIFRAGPQHAAVNNGQFDTYGWIPNSPGLVASALPDTASPEEGHFTERQFWQALPSRECTLAQTGMVWVLSTPTTRSLVHSGEAPAFHPALSPKADQIIGGFRRQLHSISERIQLRNDQLDVPYRYLNPMNISRSTDI